MTKKRTYKHEKVKEEKEIVHFIDFQGKKVPVTWDTHKDVYELFIKNEYVATVKVAYDANREQLIERAQKVYPRLRTMDVTLFEFRFIQRV